VTKGLSDSFAFVELAKQYANYSTDAPLEYTEVMAIQILGFALGRDVVHKIQPKEVHHNSYSVFLGESTLARKDTIQSLIGIDMIPVEYQVTNSGSPEGFLEDLADLDGVGFQFLGEWSKELKGIKSGGYAGTFSEVKNDVFNCKRFKKRLTTKKGKKQEFVIDKPFLCLNTTITPDVLKEHMTTEIVNGGYWARHIIVGGKPGHRKRGRLKKVVKWLSGELRNQLYLIMRIDKGGCHFEFSDEALKYYNDVVEEEATDAKFRHVRSSAGRYLDYVCSFADCLLVSEALGEAHDQMKENELVDLVQLVKLVKLVESISQEDSGSKLTNTIKPTNPTNPTKPNVVLVVQKRHVEEAWRILKQCLQYANEIAEYVDMGKELSRVRNYLMKRTGKWCARSDVMRMKNVSSSKKMDEVATTLYEREEIVVDKRKFRRKNNTTGVATFYRWVGDDVEEICDSKSIRR